MTDLAPHDVAPSRGELDHLLDTLPGGEFIKPHADDGPWYFVCVTRWEEPNWQLESVLTAYPGVRATVYDTNYTDNLDVTFHVVPKFGWRMCQWHSVEFEADIDTDDVYAAGPFDEKPSQQDLLTHISSVQHPEDCQVCVAGEFSVHNYEPPQDTDPCSGCDSGPCRCDRINQDIDERKGK